MGKVIREMNKHQCTKTVDAFFTYAHDVVSILFVNRILKYTVSGKKVYSILCVTLN